MPSTVKKSYDVIIIGSGPGGALTARNLSQRGADVLLLEKGRSDKFTADTISQLPMLNAVFIDGFNTILRGITAGGSTMLYFGTAMPVPHEMFKKYGIHLEKSEKVMRAELPIQKLNDNLLSEHARHLTVAAEKAGFNWQPLPKMIHTDRIKPGYQPVTARWNAREPLTEAINNRISYLTEAEAQEILTTESRVSGVKYTRRGRVETASAPVVISAAGGVASASLFRQSSLPVSEGFFCDPLVGVMGASDHFRETFEPLPMLTGTHDSENGIMLTDMPLPWPIFSAFSLQTLRPDLIFKKKQTLTIMVKIRDELAGHIAENDRASRKLTPADRQLLDTGIRRAETIMHEAGVKKTSVTAVTSAHPGGSIRIGDRLDENLQSDIKGLYVCDASVIPEPWGLPPTLTLLSLADRLSAHLSGSATAAEAPAGAGL